MQRTALRGLGWWPTRLRLDSLALHLPNYERGLVWTIVALSLVLNVAVPRVEELYFRGYLLPRLGRCGRWAPLVNTALFSVYHVWQPWEFFSRLAALLPGDLRRAVEAERRHQCVGARSTEQRRLAGLALARGEPGVIGASLQSATLGALMAPARDQRYSAHL